MKFIFITEDGRQELSYKEYLADNDLFAKVADPLRARLFLGQTIVTYDKRWLAEHKEEYGMFMALEESLRSNPLMYFLPTGEGPEGGTAFLNDVGTGIKFFVAPNRVGKTCHGVADMLLDAVPCDPEWPIFKKHGVKFREWTGPKKIGIATYNWANAQRVVWPEVKKWLPQSELRNQNRQASSSDIAWKGNPKYKLACDSEIFFFCYEQKQNAFESIALDRWLWDEQGEQDKWNGGDERLRTRPSGRHVFVLTPHKVDGRPDTGAHSWIHDLWTGKVDAGHKVTKYKIGIADCYDWNYPERAKREAYQKWVLTPKKLQDRRAMAEGEARFYGKWHESGGLVFDEWDPAIHLIDRFQIPDGWTRYRSIDYGTKNQTACLWGAVNPDGDLFLYREYYIIEPSIPASAEAIVRMSGNEVESEKLAHNARGGMLFDRRVEKIVKERFHSTVLDGRSCKHIDGAAGMTIMDVFALMGLRVTQASMTKTTHAIPIAKEFFKIDNKKPHFITKLPGAPRIYVFRDLQYMIEEINEYIFDEHAQQRTLHGKNTKEDPRRKKDHLIDALLYMIQIPPRYFKDRWAYYETNKVVDEDEDERKPRRFLVDRITGY